MKIYKKTFTALLLVLFASSASLQAKEESSHIGVVNFATCIQDSKFGKQEQESLDALKTQLQKNIEDIQSQLNNTVSKLQDTDYLDSLNPDAEKELKAKFQSLNEELNRYQGQYYQIMQQAHMKLVQSMNSLISEASSAVAKEQNLDLVINRDAVLHFAKPHDITPQVVQEMDQRFEKQVHTK